MGQITKKKCTETAHTFAWIVTVTLEPGVTVVPGDGEVMLMPCARTEDAKSAIAVAHLRSCIFARWRTEVL